MYTAIVFKTFTGNTEDFEEVYTGTFDTKDDAEKYLDDNFDLAPLPSSFKGEYTNSSDVIGKIEKML